jgi:hypothetical protein
MLFVLLATIFALFFSGALACACVNLYLNKAKKMIKEGTWQEKRHAILLPVASMVSSFLGSAVLPILAIRGTIPVYTYFPCAVDGCIAVEVFLAGSALVAVLLSVGLNPVICMKLPDPELRSYVVISVAALVVTSMILYFSLS